MPQPPPQNPFPGPRPYATAERDRLHGRAGERRDVVALVIGHRLTVLYGPTGAGKTSLVAAGVVPELERAGFQVLPVARPGGQLPPGTDPARLHNVYTANVLMHWHRGELADVGQNSLLSYLRSMPQADDRRERPLAIVIDQLEDLFLTHDNYWEQREAFVRELAECVAEAGRERPVHALVVVRDEQLAELERYAAVLPDLLRVRFRLDPLRPQAAIDAITGAARGLFTREDAEKLARDLAHKRVRVNGRLQLVPGEFVEPMQLQLACEEKWRRGGRSGPLARPLDPDEALARFYDESVARAKQGWGAERSIRRFLQDRLVSPDGRRTAAVRGKRSTGGLSNKLVDRLETERLIRAEERLGARWYELAHDRLIEPILLSNKTWFESQRRKRRWLRVTFAVLLLAALAVGLYFVVQWALRTYRGLDDEKHGVEAQLASATEESATLAAKLAKKDAQLTGERLRSRLHRLETDTVALSADVLALQGVIADMRRFNPRRDVEREAETLTNYASTGGELSSLGTRVDAAVDALTELSREIDDARDEHPKTPALKDLSREATARLPELTRLRAAVNTATAEHARNTARLLAELDGFEAPQRPGAGLAGRSRELARQNWRQGLRALLQGQADAARGLFERAVTRDGTDPAPQDMLGRLAWAAGDAKTAEQSFRKALSLRPDYGPSLASMGAVYLGKDWLLDAEHCAREALAVQPDFGPAFTLLREIQQRRAAQTEPVEEELSRKNPCHATAPAPPPVADAPAGAAGTPEPEPAAPEPAATPEPATPEPAAPEPEPEPTPVAETPKAAKKPTTPKRPKPAKAEPPAPIDRSVDADPPAPTPDG
jgi:tetratricopeptide (TPR) repeat protein